MGLLDKALRLSKPSTSPKPEGLLARAKRFRDFIKPAQPGPGLLQRALGLREKPGLFKRAQALREKLGTDRDRGLLHRASQMRSEPFVHPGLPESPASAAIETRAPQEPVSFESVEAPAAVESPVLDFSEIAVPESPASGGLLRRAERFRDTETSEAEAPSADLPVFEEADSVGELPGLWNEISAQPETELPDDMALPDATEFDAGNEFGAADFDTPDLSFKEELRPPGDEFEMPDTSEMSEVSEAPTELLDETRSNETAEESAGYAAPPAEAPDVTASVDAMLRDADTESQPSDARPENLSPEDYWDELDPGDPFLEFEKEAEAEAEQALAASPAQPEGQGDEKPLFLFDADDEFTTAPVEAHIAGQKKIDHYLSLFDIAREVSAIQDFDEFWDAVLFAVMGQLGAQTVAVFAARSAGEAAQVFYPAAVSGFEPDEQWMMKPGDRLYDLCEKEEGVIYTRSLREPEQAVLLSDMERTIIEETGAEVIAPLRNNKRMYGVVFLGSTFSGDEYGIDDLEFLTLLGGLAASGVDRILARLEFDRDTETLRKRDFFHNRIMEAARDAASVRSLDELYDILVRNLTEHFSVDSYSLVLLNPGAQEYTIFAGNRISPESMERFRLATSSELIGMVSNFTRVFDVADFRKNSELARCYTNDDLGIMKHYWVVPLIYQNWLVGYFAVHSVRKDWTEFDREMAVSLAELLGPSFGGAIMLGERESLFRDPFSPLEDRLRLELKKCMEFHSALSLVELRIKNIKRVLALNPSARVTQFLGAVGRTVAGHLLQTDFLARIGQGRFALILPGRGKEEAEIFVKKVRNDLKRLNLLPGSPVDAQFVHAIVSTQDTSDPEKMLAILE